MVHETELPESWHPPAVPEVVSIPTCATDDPAQLAAWFGPFGLAENYRKVVKSSCEEVIRATYALRKEAKPSEQRLDALAHLHEAYLAFLERCLVGRTA